MVSGKDGVYVRATDDGFVEIESIAHQFGVNVGSTLRFSASSAADFVAKARAVHADEGPIRSELSVGDDVLTFRIGGHEQAPVLTIINRRTDGAESTVALKWPKVLEVADEVTALT